jgi:cytoskeletal protein RodZ
LSVDESDRADSFGRYLLRERELRGLGREEVARQTKLPTAIIDAIESGDAARMPPRAYLFGYLRSYAAAVGLDPDDVVLRWQEVEGGMAPPPEPPSAPAPRPAWRRRTWIALAAVLAVLALAVLAGLRRAQPPPERPRRAMERAPYQAPDAAPARP